MHSTMQPSPLFSEFDQYTATLKDDQKQDMMKDFDEVVAMIVHDDYMKKRVRAGLLCPPRTMPSVPLPPGSRTRQSMPFHLIPVDIESGDMILETPQPSPNTCPAQYYEPIILDPPQSSSNTCVEQYYEPMTINAPQSGPNTYLGLVYEQNTPYGCDFGGAQPCMRDTQVEPSLDFDLLSVLSPIEKPKPSPPPRRSHDTGVNIWGIVDENGKTRRPLLHEFIRQLLDNRNYSHIAEYADKMQGTFKIRDRKLAAELWHQAKGRNSSTKMTYDKLARGIRYYYSSGIIRPTPGRFTFRFGPTSGFGKTWIPV